MNINTCNYSVEMDLQSAEFCLHQTQIAVLQERLEQIRMNYPFFSDICSLRNGILRYESESLFPAQLSKKPKVLFVFGNPSIFSVKNGMFFFSRQDGGKHGFWGKLARAGLMEPIDLTSRKQEADKRRKHIIEDHASPDFSLGFTTFYSFPTPGADNDKFSGSSGVETLFATILKQLCQMEIHRILSYPFADNAIIVFTRKRALDRFYKTTGIKPIYWPIRGENSSGDVLADLLKTAKAVQIKKKTLLF